MKALSRLFVIIGFLGFNALSSFSQPSFLVTNYGKTDYSAGNQNWSIDTDNEGITYVANNNGLLVHDGTHWKTLSIPGQTIIRSVHVSPDKRIYVGSFEEFGYWQKNMAGDFRYHSLKPLMKDFKLHNNEIWKIVQLGSKIYFQSFSSLFIYDQSSIKSIRTPGNIVLLLKAGNRLFVQAVDALLYEIINDQFVPVQGSEVFSGTEIKTILPLDERNYVLGTSSQGVYLWDGKTFAPWNIPVNQDLKVFQINNGVISDNKIILGTIVKGVFILDKKGNLLEHFHTENNLQNNTVLSLCPDQGQSVWIGLDKGISNISFHQPITIYQEKLDQLGAVYAASMVKNTLYIGTNRGVFRYTMESGKFAYKGMVDNSQGQVWELTSQDGSLLCGHTNGTYQITDEEFRKISGISGGYCLQKIIHNGQEFLVQSTYTSLVFYKKSGSQWIFSHTVKGFIEPCRFLQYDHLGYFWLGHSVKGLYRLKLNDAMDSVIENRQFGEKDGLPSDFNIRVFRLDNRVVFLCGSRIFTWDDLHQKIIPLDIINKQLQGFEASSSVTDIGNNKYWFLRKNDAALFTIRENRATMEYRLLLSLYSVNLVDQYENVVQLNDSLQLFCLDNGFAIFNKKDLLRGFSDDSRLVWSDIYCFNAEGDSRTILPGNKPIQVPFSFNNLSFSFSVANSPGVVKLFQYKLEGIDANWSDWSDRSELKYTRLPKGKYHLFVRTITSIGKISNPIDLIIIIQAPWYSSTPAYFVYTLLLLGIILLLQRMSQSRIEKKHERLRNEDLARRNFEKQQAEQAIITLQNQNLQSQISHKNIQLADSTMAIIKKNEVLIAIKNELARQKEELGTRYPTRYLERLVTLIDRNIADDHDWKLFESLFDQAHENFFQRLKQAYPYLTQSDLKLCAYLKLNLSSKEIAPLLNISLRGVEIRRYRLRKRLSLASDENLVKAIMQF
ncbi:MAG: hypothetical protein HXX13_06960 [Bacteroidetes bacterium]|nr:hypothetical protein [Bacteroidota bacterium]